MKITLTKAGKRKKVKAKPVIITWEDAHVVYPGWSNLGEIDPEPCIVHTIGWLIPDIKKGHTVVVQSLGNSTEVTSDHVDSGLAIPNDMIVEIKDVK